MEHEAVFVGIDVSKAQVDVAVHPGVRPPGLGHPGRISPGAGPLGQQSVDLSGWSDTVVTRQREEARPSCDPRRSRLNETRAPHMRVVGDPTRRGTATLLSTPA